MNLKLLSLFVAVFCSACGTGQVSIFKGKRTAARTTQDNKVTRSVVTGLGLTVLEGQDPSGLVIDDLLSLPIDARRTGTTFSIPPGKSESTGADGWTSVDEYSGSGSLEGNQLTLTLDLRESWGKPSSMTTSTTAITFEGTKL
jgi:hypothetical protein